MAASPYPVATLTILGSAPYTQSKQHDEPFLEGESHDDRDARTWRSKLNAEVVDGVPTVVIPAHGLHQCLIGAAQHSSVKIPGKGNKTWTAKFTSGVTLIGSLVLLVPDGKSWRPATPDDAVMKTISANADGKRGSGKRVTRRFPQFLEWASTFEVTILDPIITDNVFRDMVNYAGMFVGLGQFRPEKGGFNGRFALGELGWQDNRVERPARKAA